MIGEIILYFVSVILWIMLGIVAGGFGKKPGFIAWLIMTLFIIGAILKGLDI